MKKSKKWLVTYQDDEYDDCSVATIEVEAENAEDAIWEAQCQVDMVEPLKVTAL